MARKKILWLCSWYPGKTDPFNGDFIQRHARAAALYNDIHVIHVIETSSDKVAHSSRDIRESPGLTEEIIYIKRKEVWWSRMMGHYRWLASFRQAIRRYVWDKGKPDLVHVHVPMKAGLFGLWMKRKYGIKYVVTEHWGIYNDVEKLNYSGRSATFKRYTRMIFSAASRFISVSKFLAEGVNKLVLKKNYDVIRNVVDTDLFFYREKSVSVFQFIHVSNMVPLKNVGGILQAFKIVLDRGTPARLIMVGDTDPAIRELASKLALSSESVQFRGEIRYEQVANEMQNADAFILFSNIENSPCVIGEALCCGLPVIATDVGGIPELVDETNAVLVTAKDIAGLVSAMQHMIDGYSVYNCKKIAEDAQRKFSYPVIGKKLDDIYTSLTSRN